MVLWNDSQRLHIVHFHIRCAYSRRCFRIFELFESICLDTTANASRHPPRLYPDFTQKTWWLFTLLLALNTSKCYIYVVVREFFTHINMQNNYFCFAAKSWPFCTDVKSTRVDLTIRLKTGQTMWARKPTYLRIYPLCTPGCNCNINV